MSPALVLMLGAVSVEAAQAEAAIERGDTAAAVDALAAAHQELGIAIGQHGPHGLAIGAARDVLRELRADLSRALRGDGVPERIHTLCTDLSGGNCTSEDLATAVLLQLVDNNSPEGGTR